MDPIVQQIYSGKIIQIMELVCQHMSKLDVALCKPEMNSSTQQNEAVDRLLIELVRLFTFLVNFVSRHPPKSLVDQSVLQPIVRAVPRLIAATWRLLSSQNLCKISTVAHQNKQAFVNKLVMERTKLVKSAMVFTAHFCQSSSTPSEFKFKLIYNSLDNAEFLVRFDDLFKIENELEQFVTSRICTAEQRIRMRGALEKAYEEKRSEIKDTLAKQQMMEFLGHPKERLIADQLQELVDLMPDLSRQQLHLCLRHFGYDFERVLEALCEREKLPFDLKILLRINDTFDDVRFYEHKMLPSFNDEDSETVGAEANNGTSAGDTGFDLESLKDALKLLEESENVVEMNGKALLRQTFRERDKVPTEDESKALREASLKFAQKLNTAEEDEERRSDEDGNNEDDEERRRILEDKRLAAEVGRSGRFNRFLDEDEYDDTFEHAQLHSQVDAGAMTTDERETMEMPHKRCTVEKEKKLLPSANAKNASQKKGSNRERGDAAKQTPKSEQNNAKNAPSQPATAAAKQHQSSSSSSAAYTGGRERQLKERNKGNVRQRGADRKTRKNPF